MANGSGEKQLTGTRGGRERESVCVCTGIMSSKKTESRYTLMRSLLMSRSDTEPACLCLLLLSCE